MSKKNIFNQSSYNYPIVSLKDNVTSGTLATQPLNLNASDLQFDATNQSANITLSGGNFIITHATSTVYEAVQTIDAFTSFDNICAEFTINATSGDNIGIGFAEVMTCGTDAQLGVGSAYTDSMVYVSDGTIVTSSAIVKAVDSTFVYGLNDIITIFKNENTITWFLNGTFFYEYTYTGSKDLHLTVCDTSTSSSSSTVELTKVYNDTAVKVYTSSISL